MSFVSIKHLSKSYTRKAPIIKNLSLSIKKGEFVSVIGPYGCGKTTLLRLIAGLSQPELGTISINRQSPQQIRKTKRLGLCFQSPTLLPWFNTIENILLPQQITGKKDLSRGLDLLQLINLKAKAYYPIKHLSGGTQKLVAILRSLILNPNLLLLDEPFASIDEANRELLQEKLIKIHRFKKMTTILVTHSLSEAVYLSDRVFVLTNTPAQLKTILNIKLNNRSKDIRYSKQFSTYVKRLKKELVNE